MIKLRKRIPVEDRVGSVILIDLCNDPDYKEANKYVITKYCKLEWEKFIEEYANSEFKTRWLVIDNDKFFFYENYDQVLEKYKTFSMFTKKDRSSFKYWFSHWCAFQTTALNLGVWKWKYLFHDIEKPFLRLIWKYKKVQQFHRKHNSHHLEYGLEHGWDKIDWMALVIDWECCQYSKQEAQLDARETLEFEISRDKWKKYEREIRKWVEPLLSAYDL